MDFFLAHMEKSNLIRIEHKTKQNTTENDSELSLCNGPVPTEYF